MKCYDCRKPTTNRVMGMALCKGCAKKAFAKALKRK